MPHHFLYHKNVYHILITKPSLPHLYLYHILKLARMMRAISPKLARTTAKNGRSLFPLLHPGNVKTIACVLYLYHIQKISAQFARYFPKITEQASNISSLSSDDMQRIAEKLNNDYFIGFEEVVKFVVSCELAEKRKYKQEPMQQESNT